MVGEVGRNWEEKRKGKNIIRIYCIKISIFNKRKKQTWVEEVFTMFTLKTTSRNPQDGSTGEGACHTTLAT